jgi:sarcosine oxidase subunit beta
MTGPVGGGRIIIVGGGVIGVSIAYHLSALGHRDVLVLDRGNLGEGTTARATGGIRQQFTSLINARLGHRSVRIFQSLSEATGEPFDFRQHGYLFLLSTDTQLAVFRRAVAMQNELGIPSRIVDSGELSQIYPELRIDDLLGGSYCPTDGSASPADAVQAWAKAARRAGVQFHIHREVTGFLRTGASAVRGVRTSSGDVEGEAVVLATGPWCRELGHELGLTLHVEPHRRQAFAVEPLPWLRPELPVTVDLATGAYIHPEVHNTVVGGNDRNVPEGTSTSVDWELSTSLMSALVDRWPKMEAARLVRGWAGLRAMTPDDHAIVGPVAGVDGLWVAVGFSGHGFMQAPAIGETVAQLLLTGTSNIDITALRASRFAEGQAIAEEVIF